VVLLALLSPVVWLAPGCGARSDLDESDDPTEPRADAGPPDVRADVPLDVVPDVPGDHPIDVPPDVVPDVPQDVVPDVPEDVVPDVPEDVVPDVPEDVPPDVPEDVPPDVPEDVPPDVQPDGPCQDIDGDGYTTCDDDCDDVDPLVNPGAFDFINGIDDDCDGAGDNPATACGGGLLYTSQDPVDYAKAIDLCQATTLDAMGADKKWGLISAEFRLANGTGAPAAISHAIVTSLGSVLGPRKNQNFVYLSSGPAGVPGQQYWQPGVPQGSSPNNTSSSMPPGFPTNKAGCPLPFSTTAFDPVNLRLTVRTPTNAQSLGFDHGFFSAEYPEWACSFYNDMWVALLETGASGIANNKNIIFDGQGTPGTVNLNFFDRCVAGQTGCAGGTLGFNFCAGGKAELAGTGFGDVDSPCGTTSSIGGSTGWLTTESPMLPGEVIVVQFIVWDTSDGILDSSSMLDNFHWLEPPLGNPITYRP
jgi:hypothetical protein